MAYEYVPIIEDWIKTEFKWEGQRITEFRIPAWSLHRLWELGNFKHIILDSEDEMPQIYEFAIDNIEKQIKQEIINKKYLK